MRRFASKTLKIIKRTVNFDKNKQEKIDLRVKRVHSDLILSGISDQTLVVGEGDVRWCCTVTLVVGYDLDAIVLPDADT